jgi:pimeloyl-ACP methyl ester carboxylesterase
MKLLVLLSIVLFVGKLSADWDHADFVNIGSAQELYVEYKAAEAGYPTIVLVNGLTYSTKQWDAMTDELLAQDSKYGILRYDMRGQGQTLLRYAPALYEIPVLEQVEDLRRVLVHFDVENDSYLVGLSYGGAIAVMYESLYPRSVKGVISIAPYVKPLTAQDTWIRSQIWFTRNTNPANPFTDDELYDYFLKQIVYSTYPSVEPIVLENPFKLEGVYKMVKGIRHHELYDFLDNLSPQSTTLVVAVEDQYVEQELYDDVWSQMPDHAKRARFLVTDTEHKIPEAIPAYAAGLVLEIVKGNPYIKGGNTFEGFPRTGKAIGKEGEIALPKEN